MWKMVEKVFHSAPPVVMMLRRMVWGGKTTPLSVSSYFRWWNSAPHVKSSYEAGKHLRWRWTAKNEKENENLTVGIFIIETWKWNFLSNFCGLRTDFPVFVMTRGFFVFVHSWISVWWNGTCCGINYLHFAKYLKAFVLISFWDSIKKSIKTFLESISSMVVWFLYHKESFNCLKTISIISHISLETKCFSFHQIFFFSEMHEWIALISGRNSKVSEFHSLGPSSPPYNQPKLLITRGAWRKIRFSSSSAICTNATTLKVIQLDDVNGVIRSCSHDLIEKGKFCRMT